MNAEQLKSYREEIKNFFDSDKQFKADNMEILDSILEEIYNLNK